MNPEKNHINPIEMHRNNQSSLTVFHTPQPYGPSSPCSVHFPSTVRLAALSQARSTRLSDWNSLGDPSQETSVVTHPYGIPSGKPT